MRFGRVRRAVCASMLAVAGATTWDHAQAADATLSPADMDTARQFIEESEKQWVASVVSGDPATLERIIADDVIDVDSEGNLADKATMLAQIKGAPKYFTSNTLDFVKVRFFGHTAVAQGSETWSGQNGLPAKGRFVFTDTWVLRDGKWQVVSTAAITAAAAK